MKEKLNISQIIVKSIKLAFFCSSFLQTSLCFRGKYLFELCYDTYTFTKSLLLRHNSRYSLLNEPINDGECRNDPTQLLNNRVVLVEFVRNGSDVDSIDYNVRDHRCYFSFDNCLYFIHGI